VTLRRSLYGRLSTVLLALLLAVGVVGVVVTLATTGRYLEEVDQKLHRDVAEHMVVENPLFQEGEVNEEGLHHLFHMLMVINPRIEIYLLSADGAILAYSAPPERVQLERVPLAPIERFLAGERLPLHGANPRNPGTETIFSAAPIRSSEGETLQGYLYVVLAGDQLAGVVERLRGSYILRLSAWTLVASVAIALLAGLLLFRRLTRRLSQLDKRMHRLQASGFTQPSPGEGARTTLKSDQEPRDEIDRLDRSFAAMAERIADQIDGLEQVDRLRRELVGNVSHDLRTPLASLQGYLETLLLKDGALPASERRHYLEVAASQSERLGKLVEELFELAKLDAGETQLEIERFSMAELAQDVAQKLRLTAEQRGVHLTTTLDRAAPAVSGDLRLIERVLVNLVDNALRHTPEKGKVDLSVVAANGGVRVEVVDTGCGIETNDLPLIFDRFFRGRGEGTRAASGPGKTSAPQGAGLGLAISKRVLELHGSSIEVDSTLGLGSSFSFGLSTSR